MKYTLIPVKEIPAPMSDEAREKLDLLRKLTPETGAEVEMDTTAMRGFKAALTRIAGKNGIAIVCTSDQTKVYVQLAKPEGTPPSA